MTGAVCGSIVRTDSGKFFMRLDGVVCRKEIEGPHYLKRTF